MKMHTLRAGTAAFGALLLVAGGAAVASADDYGEEGVDVWVSVEPLPEPGTLAMTVAADWTTLTENGSTDLIRQFTGALPNVTVSDTRSDEEIPDGANWYVLGTASDFESTAGDIVTADHFGWDPALVGGSDEGDGVVSIGGEVETVLDGDRGLVDQELLFLATDLPSVEGGGAWTATADLFLRVPATVTAGDYHSVITLSLFE